MRGGSRTAHDLQQAENEARGEIIDLNSGMDRIANAANSAAEKASSPSAANRCDGFRTAYQVSKGDLKYRKGSDVSRASERLPGVPVLL